MTVHPTALVSLKAELGEGVSIGPFSIVEEGTVIGAGTRIASHVLVARGTRIGTDCALHHGAVVGTIPQTLHFEGEETILEIGDRTVIREYATLNRGTKHRWRTTVGSDCLIMAYVHVAHDCVVGDHVILSNSVALAGHVVVEDYAKLGGLVPVHQFTRIGRHSFVGGGSRVVKDVPPYLKVAGDPLKPVGLNVGTGHWGPVGLRKDGFAEETIHLLKEAYRLNFRGDLNTTQAIELVRREVPQIEEVRYLLEFIERSERGIVR